MDAPVEDHRVLSGHVILGEAADGLEQGPLESQIQPLRSLGLAIFSNSVRIASFAVMRPIPRFSLDYWKATLPLVSS